MKLSYKLISFTRFLFKDFEKLKLVNNLKEKFLVRHDMMIKLNRVENQLAVAEKVVIQSDSLISNAYVGLVQEYIPRNQYIPTHAYWPKYERFLKNNKIKYGYYNIHLSDWIEKASEFDIIIWRVPSDPVSLDEARTKIYVLENLLHKKCFPTYSEIWWYEHKIRASSIFECLNVPTIPTFITYSQEEALTYVRKAKFPLISKITTGSGSRGVKKIKTLNQARKMIGKCFSENGYKTYWKSFRQKGYVYFQEFISDSSFDLRIIVIDNKLLGYYRYPKGKDFRASGSGVVRKEALPEEAMKLAVKINQHYRTRTLAIDFLYSPAENRFYVNEASIFISVETAEQLMVDGVPGYYAFEDDLFKFHQGRYWIQELSLAAFFRELELQKNEK